MNQYHLQLTKNYWRSILGKLPVISGKYLCKLLAKLGYLEDHQTGSHIILRNISYPYRRITVPNHKEVAKGTLRSIIRETGITLEQFNDLMD